MELKGSVAVVTGGNGGLGRHLVAQLLERGASKVYVAGRKAETDVPGATALELDVTDPEAAARAARIASDATLLINGAGVNTHAGLITGDIADIREELEVAYFGSLNAIRAFAPVLEANGGGTIVNVCSQLSWVHFPDYGAYSGAKAAEWALTNATRQELAPRGIRVSGLYVGYMDTPLFAEAPEKLKSDAATVASRALDGIVAGADEIFGDDFTGWVKEIMGKTPDDFLGTIVEKATQAIQS
jgi:NAD(P)-dependent dehydrogenase (short-subunit alcohol dehydrogenase family)